MHPAIHTSLVDVISGVLAKGWRDKQYMMSVPRALARVHALAWREEASSVYCVVSLANLLTEVLTRTHLLDESIVTGFLQRLAAAPDGRWINNQPPEDLLLKGKPITCSAEMESRVTCSMISLKKFLMHYAMESFGYTDSTTDLDRLWENIRSGVIRTAVRDVHLGGFNGCVWITDAERLKERCDGAASPANEAYDCLGLDWPTGTKASGSNWESEPPADTMFRTRAVLLCCPLGRRRSPTVRVRAATAIEGFNNLFWTPCSYATATHADNLCWGNCAVNASTGRAELPEGVHGRVDFGTALSEIQVQPVGEVVGKECGLRLRSLGKKAFKRAFSRLIEAVKRLSWTTPS